MRGNLRVPLQGPALLCILLMHVNNLLDLIVAAQEDARSVVNVFWDNLNHPPHVAIDCLPTSYPLVSAQTISGIKRRRTIFENHGHWSALVKNP